MTPKTKAKISALVHSYEKMFPEEYKLVKDFIKDKRELLAKEYAETGQQMVQRALYEVPEMLDSMFKEHLDESELVALASKEGGRWFAKEFSVFRITKKV